MEDSNPDCFHCEIVRCTALFGENAQCPSHHSYISLFSALLEFCLACREQSDEGTNDNDELYLSVLKAGLKLIFQKRL